jgi:3'(2'), 5'-bisphosphate nucleotidase
VQKWNELVKSRKATLRKPLNPYPKTTQSDLKNELKEAMRAVKLASFASRSLQNNFMKIQSLNKRDTSPVTIADFTVQAIIIDWLSHCFPNDRFIAEEDSHMLQTPGNEVVCDSIISAITAATGEFWDKKRLYHTLDKGKFADTTANSPPGTRVWVLDPIDGTLGIYQYKYKYVYVLITINCVLK